ncbi:DUF1801 domain-containing protein [Bacillaceae bacterium Marseille-Q3522]|nr:DUF1801 domain-containing protein [Bacillaceae bacterium Marseille-Q3522]
MYELKTKETDNSVIEFIENIDNTRKREDAYQLLDIFSETTGLKAKMWGPSMIGFGRYHYKYKSGHEGESFLAGFSPRKSAISLYLMMEGEKREQLLNKIGKYRSGKACVYVNKLADVEIEVLKEMIQESVNYLQKLYPEKPNM